MTTKTQYSLITKNLNEITSSVALNQHVDELAKAYGVMLESSDSFADSAQEMREQGLTDLADALEDCEERWFELEG